MLGPKIRFVLCFLLICAAAVVPASAQHFRQVPGNLTQVSAGRNEVWGLWGSTVYRFNSSTQKFAAVPLPSGVGWFTQIVVGGGALLEKDEVWGISNASYLYRYDFTTKAFVYVAGGKVCRLCIYVSYSQIAIGPGYEDNCHPYEIWGISNVGQVRYNYCTSAFDSIASPGGAVVQFATGGGDVWALVYDGLANPQTFEYQGGSGWHCCGGQSNTFQQITVGVNDVWGIGLNFQDSQPAGNITSYPSQPPGSTITQIAEGADGTWIIYDTSSANGLIARWDFQQGGFSSPFSLAEPVVQIAAGSGAGVWAISSSNHVYAFVRP